MIDPIAALQASAIQPGATFPATLPAKVETGSFTDMLLHGVETTNAKIVEADRMVAAFAVDDSIPVHQVTFALEEARLSLELMIQVRNRLIESYQQMMNMQV